MTSPIDYVARGWPVFPCHSIERGRCTCKLGTECDNPGKHPLTQHGFKDASTDPNMINLWLGRWPNANWALPTGSRPGSRCSILIFGMTVSGLSQSYSSNAA